MPDFTQREQMILEAGLRLLRHDVPHLQSETAELSKEVQGSRWPTENELDALHEKLAVIGRPTKPNSERSRFVVYDFDADQLITTNVFDTAEEAAEQTDRLTDVLVLRLSVPEAKLDPLPTERSAER